MESIQPQRLSFADFCERATLTRLVNHGRAAEAFFDGKSIGFVDAMGERGLRQAHKREVNNALFMYSEFASFDQPRPALPTAEALEDYRDLIEKFPAAASVLGFYVERDCSGKLNCRYCFPDDDERQLLQCVMTLYGYLVKRNERVSLLEFADRLSQHYDLAEPRNRLAFEALRSGAGVSKFAAH